MSNSPEKMNAGWLKDYTGKKFLPKTLITQLYDMDGVPYYLSVERRLSKKPGYITTNNLFLVKQDQDAVAAKNGAEIFNDLRAVENRPKDLEYFSNSGHRNYGNIAIGEYSHAEGSITSAIGNYSHTEGFNTIAEGGASHTEGILTSAIEQASHAEGINTTAQGEFSHAEGTFTKAKGLASHAEGTNTEAEGLSSHAEGDETIAKGTGSHTEGCQTVAERSYAHAEGNATIARGLASHAEGYDTIAEGEASHAEGNQAIVEGNYAHAEGERTVAKGIGSHVEGCQTVTEGDYAHAEGYDTRANGEASHAEGSITSAIGDCAHAGGFKTTAEGTNSFAHGKYLKANGEEQFVIGKYNTIDDNNTYAFIVGNGTSSSRKNALTLDWEGTLSTNNLTANNLIANKVIIKHMEPTLTQNITNAVFNRGTTVSANNGVRMAEIKDNNSQDLVTVNYIKSKDSNKVVIGIAKNSETLNIANLHLGYSNNGPFIDGNTLKATFQNLTIDNEINFNVNTGNNTITFKSNTNYIKAPNSGAIAFNFNSPASEANSSLIIKNNIIRPGTSGSIDLGNSNYKWKNIYGTKVYGAVWNDYAEYRKQVEKIEAGYCVTSNDNGIVNKTSKRLQACDGIVSDTFGFSIGETDNCKTPLAVAGRVLAYCEGDRHNYHAGDTVCAGPNGKVVKMTREEIREWPDRIVGIVSEIPDYEIWGSGNIKVNGRIWIKVK